MILEYRGIHTHVLHENEHLNGRWIYGYLSDKNYISSPELEGEFLVDESTVGQFTGKLDKHGNKIYKGDIVRFAKWEKGEMCWVGSIHFDNCLYYIKGFKNKECETVFELQLSRIPCHRIEVIGNIYENADLLKVSDSELGGNKDE